MSRLTDKIFHVPEKVVGYSCDEICDIEISCEACPIQEAFNKLSHYEDLEEAGRLIELPCNIGDTMWRVVEMSTGKTPTAIKKFVRIVTLTENNAFDISRKFGKTVFLTKAEAEAKLEEMESANE